jgi:membrane protein implicated in regulation of membrane protease activity
MKGEYMLTLYGVCAAIGVTILLLQILLMLMGVDGGGDVDVDAGFGDGADGSSAFFGVVSFRALVAALAFFGLGGLAGEFSGMGHYASLLLAIAAGGAAMLLMAWLMRSLHQLYAEGNVRIENALGRPAQVYLSIPGHRAGSGKVTVSIQSRTMEFAAVTSADELPTGSQVEVVGIVGRDTLEVAPAEHIEGE